MKIFIALMVLSIAPSVFAEGSWDLNCVNAKGLTLSSSNGISEIQNKSKVDSIEIENYDLGLSQSKNTLKWIGSPVVINETVDNVCSTDHAVTIFKQKAKISVNGLVSTEELICTDSVVTSSGASDEDNSCLGE